MAASIARWTLDELAWCITGDMTFPAGTEDEISSQARADLAAYIGYMVQANVAGRLGIEKRYGLYGLSPQRVSEELAKIAISR